MAQSSFEIYLQICLPFIRITKEEREQIKEDPVEFVNNSIDIVEDQESGNLKGTTARLM